jgi:hypothetical protein
LLKPEGVRSLMYEGKTVENMVDWLYENCGQPAQSFESISPEDLENFYYIDRTFHSNPGVDFRSGLQGQWAAVAQVPNLRLNGSLDSSY